MRRIQHRMCEGLYVDGYFVRMDKEEWRVCCCPHGQTKGLRKTKRGLRKTDVPCLIYPSVHRVDSALRSGQHAMWIGNNSCRRSGTDGNHHC